MKKLKKQTAAELGCPATKAPVKVLQFGEGNFLRAFIDWMIDEMNSQGLFKGNVAVVQPLEYGMVDQLAGQDFLYTVLLRGVQAGEVVVKRKIIPVIERGVKVYAEFAAYLQEAHNPDLRIIVSNTTEAGIELCAEDQPSDRPPRSFPAKLLCLMKERYDRFDGDPSKGFLLFPCELIDRNGDVLKSVLTELAGIWYPDDAGFRTWLAESNVYFNTLVDRIVSGYPRDEAAALCKEFGYQDDLVVAAEIFHFLVVEGPVEYEKEFPLVSAGLNVKWCDDLTPYRTRKVRILNGAHTMMVPMAYLAGLETVQACMDDKLFLRTIRNGIFDEIIPTLDLPQEELVEFGNAVLERFSNPYIKHFLLSIALNSVSKFKTRVLPSVLEYKNRTGRLPEILCASLSALVLFYRAAERGEHVLRAVRSVDGKAYEISDSPDVLNFFFALWSGREASDRETCTTMMQSVLSQVGFWGLDLTTVDGLVEQTAGTLFDMLSDGVAPVLRRMERTL